MPAPRRSARPFPILLLSALTLLSISACSRREHAANSAETASPIAIEQVSVPGATATPPAPAASAAVGAAASASVPTQAAVVPLKVPVEDTLEPISVDGAAVPSAKAAKK